MQSMRGNIDTQHQEICRLTRTTQAQTKEIHSLKKKIKERDKIIDDLQNRLSKYEEPPKNSNNSSTPPSKEKLKDEVFRRTKSLRVKSDKPVGGQKGHEGTTRTMVENPDETIEESADYCTDCGHDLSDSSKELDYISQVVSIPQLRAVVKEIRHYVRRCSRCGHQIRSYAPRLRGGNSVTYDQSVQALVVYLNVVQCIPYQRLQSILEVVFGIEMSQGTIANILQSAKAKAGPAIEIIKDNISRSGVVGFDESGCYCDKRLDWSWIAQTDCHTLVFRAKNRSGKVLEDLFGDTLKNITAVTDRHSAYFSLDFADHQICLAHILREVQYLTELDANQQWSIELRNLLREAIHTRNESPRKVIDKTPWLSRLDRLLQQSVEHLKDEFRRLKNGLIKCRDYVFKFLENPAVPSHNNASERGIRKLKVKQKVSGSFRSDEGADAFLALHSITDTAWKNKQSPMDAILAILNAETGNYDFAE
jgi:transposase